MNGASLGRRAFVLGALGAGTAQALGRVPYGGRLRLVVPWRLERLEPHALDDAVAALFGAAVADPLYVLDELGRPYAALAEALPEPAPNGARVRLRPGLKSARGRALDARDVSASLARARARGAAGLLAEVPAPRPVAGDALSLLFPGAAPAKLAERLASHVVAVLPRDFAAESPDGTGAFRARFEGGRLLLERNPAAARGPAFLDAVEVRSAASLADALRAFEAGSADVGWLGGGLYRPRGDARAFRARTYGWAVLRTGRRAGAWSAPGVAQALLDQVNPESLRHLGLEGLPGAAARGEGWGGGRAALLVAQGASQLELVARALSPALGRPGHELDVSLVPRDELAARRASGDFALMVDFVASLGPGASLVELALLTADRPELAKKPPRTHPPPPRELGRTLGLGVIGELWIAGAHHAAFHELAGFSLSQAWRDPEPATPPR